MRDEIVKLRTDRFNNGDFFVRASAVTAVFIPDNDSDQFAFFCIDGDCDYNISIADAVRLLAAMRFPGVA